MNNKVFKNICVIGANGIMGYNSCAMFASFGNARVYMISRDIQKSRNAIDKAIKAVRAESIRKNLIPCDYSQLKECIFNSDLIFESVAENLEAKKEITQRIGLYARETAIIATGTSGLSINEISKVLPEKLRKNYYGMHFFNPPYSMPLLELIPTDEAISEELINLKRYLEEVLLRTVVISKDLPAFIANRIGFQFLNMALQYAEKYQKEGGIDFIDAILGPFTGRVMTPCTTVDFVGLDVHKAIVDNVFENTNDIKHDTFVLPEFAKLLIDEGRLGKKTYCGLFKTELDENGKKVKLVYDITSNQYLPIRKYNIIFAYNMNKHLENGDYKLAFEILNSDTSKEAAICRDFLKDYVEYSLLVAKEVCEDLAAVDDAMATGFNWCPPLALSNAVFGTNYPTKYDYRSFFKAVR